MMYQITEEDLERVVKLAFSKGENWGVTYSTWFEPDEEDNKRKIKAALISAKRQLSRNKVDS